jgi:hypothetical protein
MAHRPVLLAHAVGVVLGILMLSASAQPAGAPDAAPFQLGPAWSQDTDENGVPDFIEAQIGADPLKEDCPIRACGPVGEGSEFLRRPRNTLLLLDASGSMAARMGGATKLEVARQAISRYASIAGIMRERLGFLVYGHKGSNKPAGKPESCTGVEILSRIGDVSPDTFAGQLASFRPTGWTPIAAALDKAAEAFVGKESEANRIVLVSDGIETCGGDPVQAARRLNKAGLAIVVDVIGFDIKDRGEAAALRKIADAGGGRYHDARTANDLNAYFKAQGETLRQATDAMICEARNSSGNQLCDAQLTFRATEWIGRLQLPLSTRSPEYLAYEAVVQRIRQRFDQREQQRQTSAARVMELLEQSQQLRGAMIRAFGH